MRQLVRTIALVIACSALPWPAEAQVNPPPALPSKPYPPTPRLPDGTPNLGPVEPNKGYWHLAQFQDYKQVLLYPKEIPYQPWAKAAEGRPFEMGSAGLLHAAVRPASDDDPVPDGDHSAPGTETHPDDL
jgi:hypothetical protein